MAEIPVGWPCAGLPGLPPSVADRQSAPTADDLLPQVLALTPRGPAWGTDEAGDGRGASPIMRLFWRALAAWAAANNTAEFDTAIQALPSAITWSLPDWEREYGLPDGCASFAPTTEQRVAAVRLRYGAQGGQSPAYFICLAASLGYDVTIEEPSQFRVDTSECVEPVLLDTFFECDTSECDGDPLEGYALADEVADAEEVSDLNMWRYWIVHVVSAGETWFRADEGECDGDPLEGWITATDLECAMRREAPPHAELVFFYEAPPVQ